MLSKSFEKNSSVLAKPLSSFQYEINGDGKSNIPGSSPERTSIKLPSCIDLAPDAYSFLGFTNIERIQLFIDKDSIIRAFRLIMPTSDSLLKKMKQYYKDDYWEMRSHIGSEETMTAVAWRWKDANVFFRKTVEDQAIIEIVGHDGASK